MILPILLIISLFIVCFLEFWTSRKWPGIYYWFLGTLPYIIHDSFIRVSM